MRVKGSGRQQGIGRTGAIKVSKIYRSDFMNLEKICKILLKKIGKFTIASAFLFSVSAVSAWVEIKLIGLTSDANGWGLIVQMKLEV